jgi:hypothetical protein
MGLHDWLTVLPPALSAVVAIAALALDIFRHRGNKED